MRITQYSCPARIATYSARRPHGVRGGLISGQKIASVGTVAAADTKKTFFNRRCRRPRAYSSSMHDSQGRNGIVAYCCNLGVYIHTWRAASAAE